MGELSATRQALDGAPISPGTLATLRALIDPEKRPPTARQELSDEIQHSEPAEPFKLNVLEFFFCASALRGVAGGPSGVTAHLLFPRVRQIPNCCPELDPPWQPGVCQERFCKGCGWARSPF